jgi:hypothetical protein
MKCPESLGIATGRTEQGVRLNWEMARPVRFELTTYSFGGCRSIHLSYGRTVHSANAVYTSHSESAVCSIILALARLPRYSAFAGPRQGPPWPG